MPAALVSGDEKLHKGCTLQYFTVYAGDTYDTCQFMLADPAVEKCKGCPNDNDSPPTTVDFHWTTRGTVTLFVEMPQWKLVAGAVVYFCYRFFWWLCRRRRNRVRAPVGNRIIHHDVFVYFADFLEVLVGGYWLR